MNNYPMPKDAARKMRLENFYIDFSLICHKAGGCVSKLSMNNMSLDDFFRICALNGIDINFKKVKNQAI